MTNINIIDALVDRFNEVFKEYKFPNKNGVLQAVKIFPQYAPQPAGIKVKSEKQRVLNYEAGDFEANFPCIIVKLQDISDYEERRINMNKINIRVLFGVYDDDEECQGYRDILTMLDRARGELLSSRIVAKKYRIEMPIVSSLIEADTFPVYFGEMRLVLEAGRAVMGHEYVYKERI